MAENEYGEQNVRERLRFKNRPAYLNAKSRSNFDHGGRFLKNVLLIFVIYIHVLVLTISRGVLMLIFNC